MVGTCVEIKQGYVEECFDRTNKKSTTNRQTQDQMERHGGKGDMRPVDGNATMDWALDREKWRGLLVAARVLDGPLRC